MAETIRTELGKNQKFGDDCPKNDFNFTENFEKVRFNVARNFWIDHVAIFNNFR